MLRIGLCYQRRTRHRCKTILRSISRIKLLTRSPYARAVLSLRRSLSRPVKSTRRRKCANPCTNSVIRRWSSYWNSRRKRTNALVCLMIASLAHLKRLHTRIRTLCRLARYTRVVELPPRNHLCILPCVWASVATSSKSSFSVRSRNIIRTSSAGTSTQFSRKSARASQERGNRYHEIQHNNRSFRSSIKV